MEKQCELPYGTETEDEDGQKSKGWLDSGTVNSFCSSYKTTRAAPKFQWAIVTKCLKQTKDTKNIFDSICKVDTLVIRVLKP
jgi:uncharacterized protein (DUF169 family)